jgi:hypothetical protein
MRIINLHATSFPLPLLAPKASGVEELLFYLNAKRDSMKM